MCVRSRMAQYRKWVRAVVIPEVTLPDNVPVPNNFTAFLTILSIFPQSHTHIYIYPQTDSQTHTKTHRRSESLQNCQRTGDVIKEAMTSSWQCDNVAMIRGDIKIPYSRMKKKEKKKISWIKPTGNFVPK